MPLYEYHCEDCGRESELLVLSSKTTPECPKCGGHRLSKLLSIVASPSREGSSSGQSGPAAGSCGAGCGCHPHG
jgi:putative FmdB family regulatory protein